MFLASFCPLKALCFYMVCSYITKTCIACHFYNILLGLDVVVIISFNKSCQCFMVKNNFQLISYFGKFYKNNTYPDFSFIVTIYGNLGSIYGIILGFELSLFEL